MRRRALNSHQAPKLVSFFEELTKDDIPTVGGKNANLGEMIHAGIPVPPGFAITAQAYQEFLIGTKIAEGIYAVIKEVITDADNPAQYEAASKRIRKLIEEAEVPEKIRKAIEAAYKKLGERLDSKDVYVAVRSSATAEDLPDASFAGQQETYLNVRGPEDLVAKTIKCWSSLFTPRAIFYRTKKGFEHEQVLISVGVQKMVNARSAGVLFTMDPVTGDLGKLIIEGTWGLGEAVVSGSETPDHFVVEKETLEVIERTVVKKMVEYIRSPTTGETERANVPAERQEKPCITDEEIQRLANLAKAVEQHYGKAQDIEWAIDRDLTFPESVFVVQSRPETVWSARGEKAPGAKQPPKQLSEMKIVAKGIAAGRREIATGVAKVVFTTEDASKLVQKGDILVTTMTDPDFVPYMKLASAIVTDKGGVTAHAAIVSRELGIPCVVGAETATKTMKTGERYTVDSRSGVIYEGVAMEPQGPATPTATAGTVSLFQSAPVTATKIFMNLGVPEKIGEYKNLPFDGIGLMRMEFILASYIGEHPLFMLENSRGEDFVNQLAEGIAEVARAIQPRPVVVRFSDFKTNEYRDLKGGGKFEIEEANPMLGWRGASRYISEWYKEAFRLECRAILKCREEWRLKNVWVMLPVIRTLWEARQCLEIMEEEKLKRSRDFQVWFMAETPAIAIMADEFSKLCDAFSIGSNDMTQGILMIDRDSERLGQMGYFDERDPAVKRIIAHLIEVAHQNGTSVSICGEGPSNLPDFTEFLVRSGIDSISVNNDAVVKTRRLVASVESKILLERAIREGTNSRKTVESKACSDSDSFLR
jgi:pyruvate,water dikinase